MKAEKLNYISSIKFLSKYINKYKMNFITFYLGCLFDYVLVLIIPIIFGVMIDEIVYYQNVGLFMNVSMIFVVIMLLYCVMYFFMYAQHGYLSSMYTFEIKRDLLKHLVSCDAHFMAEANTGKLIEYINVYSGQCMHFVIKNIIHNINNILNVLFCLIYIFIINWQIGVVMLFLVPISVLVSNKFGKKIRAYSDTNRTYYESYVSRLYEMLSGIKDIRLLAAERIASKDFVSNHKKLFKIGIQTGISTITAKNIINGVTLFLRLILFVLGAYFASKGKMTIGLLIVIIMYFRDMVGCVSALIDSYFDTQMRISYLQKLYDFFQAPTEAEWVGTDDLKVSKGEILFDDVYFNYKENDVFESCSFKVNVGERVALVGKSGSGKTTLALMLIGFYKPEKGRIIVDGQDISTCTLDSIRKSIGVVQQDVLIFDGTVKSNLTLGSPKATDEEIWLACEKAGIADFINTLPQKLDTVLGKNGIEISGGQKQRISIARMYLKDPKIIIFDEATSSLDRDTEQKIHQAWGNVLQNRTSIIIAHNESSVKLCDRVIMLEDGKVTVTGTPDELSNKSSAFKNLFAMKESGFNVAKN